MSEHLCANCKWDIGIKCDDEGTVRCGDCDSEILGHEEEQKED